MHLGDTVTFRDGNSKYKAVVTRIWSPHCINLVFFIPAGDYLRVDMKTRVMLGPGSGQFEVI